MGSYFICGVLEISKKKEPNWEAARKLLNTISTPQLVNIAIEESGYLTRAEFLGSIPYPTTDFEIAFEIADGVSNRLHDCINVIEAAWKGDDRRFTNCIGAKTRMLITGDNTWGDPVETVEMVELFILSGCAKAAGFLRDDTLDE